MKFSDYYGQSSVVGELKASFNRGRVAHGFLFVGPDGVGTKTLARICAQALLCSPRGAFAADIEKPCDICGPCTRVNGRAHPDFIELETSTVQIGIDAVRQLIAALSEKPFEGGNRAVLITKGMTPDAQNALLKTLEEPPQNTVFFITAPNTSALLPTVVSRVQVVFLSALDESTCTAALISRGIDLEKARLLARLSGGIVGKALNMVEDTGFWRSRELAYEFLRPITPQQAPELAARLSKADINSREFIACVESILSDVIRYHSGAARVEIDKLSETESVAAHIGIEAAVSLLDCAVRSVHMVNSHVSWPVVAQSLVFSLVEATKGWQR